MDKNELIALYFSNKLSSETQKEFDHLIATDPEFAKDLAFQNDLKKAIQKEEQEITKRKLQTFEAEDNSGFNYKNLLVAASVIVLLGLSCFWYFSNSTINTEQLYAAHFEPYRNIMQPIVRGESKTDTKTKAFTAYESKNYDDALLYFNQLLAEQENDTIAFYKANVLLQLGNTEDAISIFENNLKTPNDFSDKTHWYLAMAYLKNNNINKAKDELNTLVNSNATFKNKTVKQLLKKLN